MVTRTEKNRGHLQYQNKLQHTKYDSWTN